VICAASWTSGTDHQQVARINATVPEMARSDARFGRHLIKKPSLPL